MKAPSQSLRQLVEAIIGDESVSWTRPELGLSKAERFSVRFARGDRVFVKAATDEDTEAWLRNEQRSLGLEGSFQPRIIAFVQPSDQRPVLLTEDLSQAYWPASHAGVQWRPGDIERVIRAVRHMSTIRAPTEFGSHTVAHFGPHWPAIISAADELLRLGFCSEGWLDAAGPVLAATELRLPRGGEAVVHGDVRSDNICIRDDDVIFVDWSSSGRGHPLSDLAELLPTLIWKAGRPRTH